MRLHEIIQTPISPTISYDIKTNRLDFDDGCVTPKLTLKNVHRIKLLRLRHKKELSKLRKFRSIMYGGGADKRAEIEAAQAELDTLQQEIQTLERQRDNKDDVMALAMKHIRRKY